jgi:hypothetical protein
MCHISHIAAVHPTTHTDQAIIWLPDTGLLHETYGFRQLRLPCGSFQYENPLIILKFSTMLA